jgi:hypothetical protein
MRHRKITQFVFELDFPTILLLKINGGQKLELIFCKKILERLKFNAKHWCYFYSGLICQEIHFRTDQDWLIFKNPVVSSVLLGQRSAGLNWEAWRWIALSFGVI